MASNDDTTAGAIAAPAEEALPTAPLLVAPEQPEYVPAAAEVLPAGLDGLVGADPEAGPDAADGAKPFEPLGAITNRP